MKEEGRLQTSTAHIVVRRSKPNNKKTQKDRPGFLLFVCRCTNNKKITDKKKKNKKSQKNARRKTASCHILSPTRTSTTAKHQHSNGWHNEIPRYMCTHAQRSQVGGVWQPTVRTPMITFIPRTYAHIPNPRTRTRIHTHTHS